MTSALLVSLLVHLVGASPATASPLADGQVETGIVVAEVTPRSLGALAGLQPGDILLSWCRSADADSPCQTEGKLDSPFDLAEIETEHAPRGGVRLAGRRGAERMSWTLLPGPLRIETQPVLPAAFQQLERQGRDLAKGGDLDAAAERWRTAATLAGVDGRRLSLWFLGRAADAFARANRQPSADQLYEEAVAAARQRPDPAAEAAVLLAWARILEKRRDWDKAADCYNRALALFSSLSPDSLRTAQILHELGVMTNDRNDPEHAQTYLRDALEIRGRLAPRSFDVSATLNVLGTMASKRGDLETAETLYQRALALDAMIAPASLDSAWTLTGSGKLALRRGDLATAEERLRRARMILADAEPVGSRMGDVLNALGVMASQRGDREMEEDLFRRSLAIAEALDPTSRDTAGRLHNLGALAAEKGDFEAAERYTRRSLTVDQMIAPESSNVADDLFNLGRFAYDRGDLAAAQIELQRSLVLREKINPGSPDVASVFNALGFVAGDRGQFSAAEEDFRKALMLWERWTPGTESVAQAMYNLGRLRRLQGKSGAAAAKLFCRAVDILESQRNRLGETDRSFFGAHADSYYTACLGGHLKNGDKAGAFRIFEQGRARAFLESLADVDLLASGELPSELARRREGLNAAYDTVQSELAGLDPAANLKKAEELRSRQHDIRTQQDQLAATIRRQSPRYASLHDPETLDLGGARRALDPGTVLLAYAVDEERTYLLVVETATAHGSGLTAFTLAAGEKALRSKITAFRNLLQNSASDRKTLIAQAAELYDLLVRPAERQIAGAKRILVSPDGSLHTLPFAALVRTSAGKNHYFAEWKPIHSILSATVYAELRKKRRPESDTTPLQLVAFGDPLYPQLYPEPGSTPAAAPEVLTAIHRGLSLEPLPASRAEVEGLASLFPGSRIFLGKEATEERVKEAAPGARLLHFACHGFLDERTPLDSALVLSLPNSSEKDNGLLQAWEIAEDLHLDADLVTLSACDTALGRDMGSEGLIGLTRAFQIAGARSVVATLWSVADASTADLMKRFYGYLRQGKSKDEALQKAQVDLIHSPTFSHPYFWAAFQLSGDWRTSPAATAAGRPSGRPGRAALLH